MRQEIILPAGAEPIVVLGGNAQAGFAAAQFQPAAFSQAAAADECAAGMNDRDLEAAIERDLQAGLSRELGAPQFHA